MDTTRTPPDPAPVPMNGYRFTVERQRLCAWLEDELGRLSSLAEPARAARRLELEDTFRRRLDALYATVRNEL